MKLVIDMPEKNYEIIKSMAKEYRADTIEDYIANGTPLEDIRAEINRKIQEENYGVISDHTHEDGLEEALDIINKYIGDTE